MSSSKGSVLAPLTGVVAALLMALAVIFSGDTPDTGDGGQSVIKFFSDKESSQTASVIMLAYGALFLIFFAGVLRSRLRRASDESEGTATLAFGGGLVMAAGLMLMVGISASLVQDYDVLDPAAAQAVNALSDGFWITFLAGQSVFMIGSGLAIRRSGLMPSWLAWTAIVLGVVSTTPVGWFAFMVVLLWVAVVAVLLARSARASGDEEPAAT